MAAQMKHPESNRIEFVVTNENLYTISVDGYLGNAMAYRLEKTPKEVLVTMIKYGAKLYHSKSYPKVPAFFKDIEQALKFADEFIFPVIMLQDMAGIKVKTYDY